jgi:putative ABC transport system permease protein
MRAWLAVRIALRALRLNPLRSGLTMLGVVIGVASVITMIAVGSGAREQIAERVRSIGANLLSVRPGAQSQGGVRFGAGTRHTLIEADAEAIAAEVANVVVAAPVINDSSTLVWGNRNWQAAVIGTTPDYLVAREWPVRSGRAFSYEEVRSASKVAVIGTRIVAELFGGADPLGQSIRVNGVPIEVVGIAAEKGDTPSGASQDNLVFTPISTAKQRLIGGPHEVNRNAVKYIMVKTRTPETMRSVERAITSLLRQRHRIKRGEEADFTLKDLSAMHSLHAETKRSMGWLLLAVASVSLLVGGISIMNILLVSVTERTREVGLRLAVGARRRDIRNQFLVEAVTMTSLGGLLGVVLGVGASAAIAGLAGWPILITPGAILLALGFSALVGLIFGLTPALKAAQLDPVQALRFE